jgi:hypothetical protein
MIPNATTQKSAVTTSIDVRARDCPEGPGENKDDVRARGRRARSLRNIVETACDIKKLDR